MTFVRSQLLACQPPLDRIVTTSWHVPNRLPVESVIEYSLTHKLGTTQLKGADGCMGSSVSATPPFSRTSPLASFLRAGLSLRCGFVLGTDENKIALSIQKIRRALGKPKNRCFNIV